MKEAAEETTGVKTFYCGRKKTAAWWTAEVINSVKMKMKAFRLWMKTRRPEHRIDYERQRNENERIKRKEKAKAWSKIGRDLKEDHTGTKKLLFSIAKNYRGKNNEVSYAVKDKEDNLLVDPEKISERWREYFEDLLNSERSIDDNNKQDVDQLFRGKSRGMADNGTRTTDSYEGDEERKSHGRGRNSCRNC